ncbi:aldehyde dehydrogenase family protein [Mycobacterium xenopi 3993]|nr:aldehyde dehydrogenase family protein [Mycobacterium xenopi 3993]
MADTPKVRFESRMLIDGKLVEGQAGTFTNINPATEEVLGEVADASKADMHRAIDAARRAFDETDWSTSPGFRKACLEQFQEALEAEKEALREELILEVGCPARSPMARSSMPAGRRAEIPDQADRRLSVGNRPRYCAGGRHWSDDRSQSVARTCRGCRRNRAVELPVRSHHPQARPSAGHRQHRRAETRAGHAVQRDTARPAYHRVHRHPGRCGQCRHRVRSLGGRRTYAVAQSRSDLVHWLHRRRQTDHGKGRSDDEAPVPRTGRQIGHHRVGGRRLRDGVRDRYRAMHARRPGLR